jgi:hypothetical protein
MNWSIYQFTLVLLSKTDTLDNRKATLSVAFLVFIITKTENGGTQPSVRYSFDEAGNGFVSGLKKYF